MLFENYLIHVVTGQLHTLHFRRYSEFGSTALNGTSAVFKHVSTQENVCFVGNTSNVGVNLSKLPPSDYGLRQYDLASGERIDYDACVRTRRANILVCKYLLSTILDPKTGDIYVSVSPDAVHIPIFIGYAVPGRYDPGLRWRGGKKEASGRNLIPGSRSTSSPWKTVVSPSAHDTSSVSIGSTGTSVDTTHPNADVGVAGASGSSADNGTLQSDDLTAVMDGNLYLRRVPVSFIKQGTIRSAVGGNGVDLLFFPCDLEPFKMSRGMNITIGNVSNRVYWDGKC